MVALAGWRKKLLVRCDSANCRPEQGSFVVTHRAAPAVPDALVSWLEELMGT